MSIQKASFTIGEKQLHLGMAFSKVDQVNRLVSGFATMDNTDLRDEIVVSAASTRAFERFRGNVREMHQPIAAGRMVDFRQETYYDPKTEKFYDGVYVTAYISLGAQDTWEKVLDGTLSGFSIGGEILDATSQFVPDANKVIRFINDYELVELSLVDSPANQLCNVFSITKSLDGDTIVKGMIADAKVENVFYCRDEEIVKTSTGESLVCLSCDKPMETAGWFEYDDSNKVEKLKDVVQKYLSKNNTQVSPANNEGGVDVVVKETVGEQTEPVEEEGKAEVEVTSSVEAVVSEVIEPVAPVDEAADVSEVADVNDDLAKMFDGLKASIADTLQKSTDSIGESLKGIDERFEAVTKDFEGKYVELMAKHTELTERFGALESKTGEVEKSLGLLEGSTAIRKSNDLGGSEEHVVEKSSAGKWGGHFLGADSLTD